MVATHWDETLLASELSAGAQLNDDPMRCSGPAHLSHRLWGKSRARRPAAVRRRWRLVGLRARRLE